MSAFTAGSSAFGPNAMTASSAPDVTAADIAAGVPAAAPPAVVAAVNKEDALSSIIKWVPGEIIGAYAAAVTALAHPNQAPGSNLATGAEGWLLATFIVGALLITVLGGYNAFRRVNQTGKMSRDKRVELLVRGCLSSVGLLLWSCVIPGTATNQSDLLKRYAGAASSLVFCIAIIFGLFAEFMVLPTTIRGLGKLVERDRAEPQVDMAALPPGTS